MSSPLLLLSSSSSEPQNSIKEIDGEEKESPNEEKEKGRIE